MNNHERTPIFSHTQASYSAYIQSVLGKGKHHAEIIYAEWFRFGEVRGNNPAFDNAKNLLRDILERTDFSLPESTVERYEEATSKFLLRTHDGLEIESVVIPMKSGWTLCVSSQVGCRMGCAFCETGRMGLLRNLTTEEIVGQVFYARFRLKVPIRNIVFMGMGEPLDNYEAVMQAVRVLTDPSGMAFGMSRITISTSGRVEEIYRLIKEADPALNLAVSVNAPNDEVRNRLMPINRKHDMAALRQAMEDYCAHPRRQIFVEYVLIKDYNDRKGDADYLAEYLKGLRVKVNVIPYNSQSRGVFQAPDLVDMERFVDVLRQHGLYTLLRHNKGRKIMAACGQLGNLKLRQQLREQNLASRECLG